MSDDDKAELCRLVDGYDTGIYILGEVVVLTVNVLVRSPNFSLWVDVPDWLQSAIWEFLKECDETTALYIVSPGSVETIRPNYIALLDWLVAEKGYER